MFPEPWAGLVLFALHGAIAGAAFFLVMRLTRFGPGWKRRASSFALLGIVLTILIFTVAPMPINF